MAKPSPKSESRLMKRSRDKERKDLMRMQKKKSQSIQKRSSSLLENAILRVYSKRKLWSGSSEQSSPVTITRRGSSSN